MQRLILSATLATILATAPDWTDLRPATVAQTIDPRNFGFDLPAGPVRPGGGARVLVGVGDREVVARVHVEVADQRILLMPDGVLVARPASELKPTDDSFKPAGMDEIAARWTSGRLRNFQTKSTRHYLFVYNTSEEMALVTSRVLESMVPGLIGFADSMKLKSSEPELPLVVLMFKTEAEFQRFQKMPKGVVAYYSQLDNYIVLYEESGLAGIKPELALQQTLSTIAHEGAHQILANIGIQQRLSVWPMWLSEGLAEYLAPTSTGRRLKWKGAGQVNDMRMFELENYLKSRDADVADGHLVEQTVLAGRLTSTGYATAWSLTHHLAKNQRGDFQKLLASVSQLGPLEGDLRIEPPGVVRGNLSQFRQIFGDDFGAIEKRLVAHLKKQPYTDPFAEFPHFVGVVGAGPGGRLRREANVFHAQAQANKWCEETVAKLPADQRDGAVSTVRQFATRPAAEAAARQWLQGGK